MADPETVRVRSGSPWQSIVALPACVDRVPMHNDTGDTEKPANDTRPIQCRAGIALAAQVVALHPKMRRGIDGMFASTAKRSHR
jgi:hypothetical protein